MGNCSTNCIKYFKYPLQILNGHFLLKKYIKQNIVSLSFFFYFLCGKSILLRNLKCKNTKSFEKVDITWYSVATAISWLLMDVSHPRSTFITIWYQPVQKASLVWRKCTLKIQRFHNLGVNSESWLKTSADRFLIV